MDDTSFVIEENDVIHFCKSKIKKKMHQICSDSDSDDDDELKKKNNTENLINLENSPNNNSSESLFDAEIVKKSKKRLVVQFDSNSESENEEITEFNKNCSNTNNNEAREAPIYNIGEKGQLLPETTNNNPKKSLLLAELCDSENSDEDIDENNKSIKNLQEYEAASELDKASIKNKSKSTDDNKSKKMTGREAAKLRLEIHSESQRMTRESKISLPYHKPKTYSLKEFLEKRSKLNSVLPTTVKGPPSIAMKMSRDQLEALSERLNQRAKELVEFYKSESESDDEEIDGHQGISNCITEWLTVLVDNAVDFVEIKKREENVEEVNKKSPQKNMVESNVLCEEQLSSNNVATDSDNLTERKLTKFELLKHLADTQPKLSGKPDDIIDLDADITKPNEISKLKKRFLQHTSTKNHLHKHKVELNVISVNGGKILNETVAMTVDEQEESITEEIPGVKLKQLRQNLQNKIAQMRAEIWQQKKYHQETQSANNVEGDYDREDDILDNDEEEEEEYDEETSCDDDDDDEIIEEDYCDKPRKKSIFFDDEADESDADDDDDDDDDEKENLKPIENQQSTEITINSQSKKKVLKRILQTFVEDSDDDDDLIKTHKEKSIDLEAVKENEQLNSTASIEEDCSLPPNLPITTHTTSHCNTNLTKTKSDFDFLTPVSYLTGLQNLNSDSKFLKESEIVSPFRMPSESSDIIISDSQKSLEDLSEFCSGQFPSTQSGSSTTNNNQQLIINKDKEDEVEVEYSTQDLLDVCSGKFTGITQLNLIENNKKRVSKNIFDQIQSNPIKELKSLDKDNDLIISQLLDEEELAQFKKKFDSPQIIKEIEEVNATGLIQSDDETDEIEIIKKKRQRKLVFSDEESSDDDQQNNEEEINLHDINSDDDDEEEEEEGGEGEGKDETCSKFVVEDNVEYDSEENEIAPSDTAIPIYKPSDFFENEAELSESEWGSADEDEKDLDAMEAEQGDNEKFDENKIRQDIEKIHMRKMLDDDSHQVKLLQELLLEDGELHGTGRQKQFRWRNIDSVDADESGNNKQTDEQDDIYFDDEEESEEHWRKMRHQREMFLKEKSNSQQIYDDDDDDNDSIINDSQVLRIGQKAIKRSQSLNSNNTTEKSDTNLIVKKPFSLLSKRGSFLNRSEQTLQKLAEFTKVSTSTVSSSATVKNSRNFVFQTVQKTSTENSKITVIEQQKKRKAIDGSTPNAIKKLRLTNLSPAIINKKKLEKPERAKKLFGNNW